MAKSIFTQVTEGEFEIMHDGMKYDFQMAKYLDSLTEEILLDEELMLLWAKEVGVLHGLMCAGLRDDVIKQRALVRLKDKNGNAVQLGKKYDAYQEKIRDHVPPVIAKPGVKKTKAAGPSPKDIALAMAQTGSSSQEIKSVLLALKVDSVQAAKIANDVMED